MSFTGDVLVAFVDPEDPFMESGVSEEPQLGPVLSILDACRFGSVCLFHTPHTWANAGALAAEIAARHGGCAGCTPPRGRCRRSSNSTPPAWKSMCEHSSGVSGRRAACSRWPAR